MREQYLCEIWYWYCIWSISSVTLSHHCCCYKFTTPYLITSDCLTVWLSDQPCIFLKTRTGLKLSVWSYVKRGWPQPVNTGGTLWQQKKYIATCIPAYVCLSPLHFLSCLTTFSVLVLQIFHCLPACHACLFFTRVPMPRKSPEIYRENRGFPVVWVLRRLQRTFAKNIRSRQTPEGNCAFRSK